MNAELEREKKKIPEKTVSLWTYVLLHKEQYQNPFYRRNSDSIFPSSSAKNIHLWEAFFLRWDSESVKKESQAEEMEKLKRELEKAKGKILYLEKRLDPGVAPQMAKSVSERVVPRRKITDLKESTP